MQIKKEILESLSNQGIEVSIYPTKQVELEKKNEIVEKYQRWYKFDAEEATEMYEREFARTTGFWGLWYDAQTIYIRKGDMLFKRSVCKSQGITEEYVLNVIEREEKAYKGIYGDFSRTVNKMLQDKKVGNLGFIYPTSYGIGVWCWFNTHYKECVEEIETLLKSMNIEYRNEFSEKGWVYRYVISKKEVNRNKLVA